ncbi:hypothetical protein C0J52_16909 [Blattella germanica]|nr:hypothetical protein C0J52_16909 [Blattella germanica]
MDGDKENPTEVSEGNIQLAEKESNGDHLPQSSSMVKDNRDIDDDAEEKLVTEDGALKTNKDASEVKFISGDTQNGDAKIDIENMKIAFVGMGKEELMKFANDPFWVRLRWFLFILFWLLWAAMLAGAIAIIVLAPKCAAPAPLKWWEKSPVYKIFLPAYKDGLHSKLDYIESLGVKGIALSSLLKGSSDSNGESIDDFKAVDPEYGTLSEFKEFLAALKKKGIQLILNLVPNHSSIKHDWFNRSKHNESPYKDYYIWSPAKLDDNGKQEPPNNWLSVTGTGSAWEWSDTRQAYYLHQFHPDQPDLNFENPDVVKEFKSIFEFWLDAGVSGFQLEKIEYLLEDSKRQDEVPSRSSPGTIHDQYEFYTHLKTTNQPKIIDILAEWKNAIQNFTNGDGILSVAGKLSSDVFVGSENKSHVDLLQLDGVFSNLKKDFTAQDLNDTIQYHKKHYPNITRIAWQLSSFTSRAYSHFSEDAEGLNIVVMLLPGTPITLYGDELGMEDAASGDNPGQCVMSWSNATKAGFSTVTPKYPYSMNFENANVESEKNTAGSSLAVYKDLIAARSSPSVMYGETTYAQLANNTVFAFTRVKSGNPGYLIAFNTADYDVTVDFTALKQVPEELNVQILSSNFNDPKVTQELISAAGFTFDATTYMNIDTEIPTECDSQDTAVILQSVQDGDDDDDDDDDEENDTVEVVMTNGEAGCKISAPKC